MEITLMQFQKKAIIFDLDGVLCSTDKYHYMAWKQLTGRLGICFDRKINGRLRGVSRMDSLEIILGRSAGNYTDEEKQHFAEEKNNAYRRLLENISPEDLSDEVRHTLDELRHRGYLLAVGSSSRNTGYLLQRLCLADFFDAVADGTEISHSKPDPEVFLLAARKLKAEPSDCAVVEDARAGITAAKKAGMTALALGGDAKGCGIEDFDLTSFSGLLDIFP